MEPAAYEEMAAQQDRHWWFVARRRILADTVGRLGLPPGARILEAGAGTGGNLPMLARFGSVQALEMDEQARAFAYRRAPDIEVRPGRLPDQLPFDAGSFDLICLFDVLEHVDQDRAALTALRTLAAPGGRALLTVPACPWLWSHHDERLHHHRRYTRATLRDVVQASGWRLRRLTAFNTLLFPLAVAGRLADRLRGDQAAPAGQAMPPAPLNAALRTVFGAEAALLALTDLPYGVSLMAVLDRD